MRGLFLSLIVLSFQVSAHAQDSLSQAEQLLKQMNTPSAAVAPVAGANTSGLSIEEKIKLASSPADYQKQVEVVTTAARDPQAALKELSPEQRKAAEEMAARMSQGLAPTQN